MTEPLHKHAPHIFHGSPQSLRAAQRVREMEVERVVSLTLEAFHCVLAETAWSLLDIGTGSGLFAEAFARRGLQVAGVDPNPAMLAEARTHLPGVPMLEGSAEALPCGDKAFDLAFMGMVFHEVHDPERALREAARAARVGIALLEWPPRLSLHGPPLEHRVKLKDLARLCQVIGLGEPRMAELTHKVLFLIPVAPGAG
ncbi:MAG: class I SAM-dependent methyltransferase [Anaerolineae bacterium]|jgi:SAM-dependent methyltransferase|nr:class I SAM-dependent methyltransferase [Anaerolineae bacterium]